jgi:hypothetical protein
VLEEQPMGMQDVVTEKKNQWAKAAIAFNESRQLVSIVCGKETIHAFGNFNRVANEIARTILRDKDAEIYEKSQEELAMKLYAARDAVRRELGIEGAQW